MILFCEYNVSFIFYIEVIYFFYRRNCYCILGFKLWMNYSIFIILFSEVIEVYITIDNFVKLILWVSVFIENII